MTEQRGRKGPSLVGNGEQLNPHRTAHLPASQVRQQQTPTGSAIFRWCLLLVAKNILMGDLSRYITPKPFIVTDALKGHKVFFLFLIFF